MAAVLPQELFLSHSSLDRQFTDEVAAVLRAHGVTVWYSKSNIMGAQQWQNEIGAALRRCDWFAVILSPQSVAAMWVKRELAYALEKSRFENRIVPILYQPCDYEDLSWTLSAFQTVDFTLTHRDGYLNLLRVWNLTYRP